MAMGNERQCKRCRLDIIDGQAYKLGQEQWHVACFACSKCQKALGVNSNFLVLGTGALVCSDCSYTCKSCSKKIYDLAILTGDQAYCAECFKCKSCKRPIDDLKYARTSKGLFCMPCHHMLMEKKKKYEMMKLKRGVKKVLEENKTSTNNDSTVSLKKDAIDSSESSGITADNDVPVNIDEDKELEHKKQLLKQAQLDIQIGKKDPVLQLSPKLIDSSTTSSTDPIMTTHTNDSSLSTFDINDYSDQPPLVLDESGPKSIISSLGSVNLEDSSGSGLSGTPKITQHQNFSSTSQQIIPNTPNANANGEDLPVRSPFRNTITPVKKSTSQYRTPELSTPARNELRSSKLYRTGYVLEDTINKVLDVNNEQEPESFINLDDETEEESIVETAENTLMSPIKSDPNNGLNIMMNDKDDHIKENYKFGEELNSSPKSRVSQTPQRNISHQRTISATETMTDEKRKFSGSGLGRSLTKVFKSRKSIQNNDDINSTPKQHTRTRSDHSYNMHTPTITHEPIFNHYRSISETTNFQENELSNLKTEINTLTTSKVSILKEIQNLQLQKKQLEQEVLERQKKLKDLDSLITKHPALYNQSMESLTRGADYGSIVSSNNASHDGDIIKNESLDQFVVPTLPQTQQQQGVASASSSKKSGGFMRRFFGGNNNYATASNTPTISSSSGISQPMNPMHGDDAILAMSGNNILKNSMSYNENLNSQQMSSNSSQMKQSRSTKFLRNGLMNNKSRTTDESVNNSSKLYSMTIQELANYENRSMPFIIETCIQEVTNKGLKQEGIYRISASTSNVEKLESFFENRYSNNDIRSLNNALDVDINALAGLLKRYLKKAPDSLIPFENYNSFIAIGNIKSDASKINMLREIIINIPKSNQIVLYALIGHLNDVSDNEQWNKMNLKSLATVFAPTLVRDETLDPHQEIQDNRMKTQVMEYLFNNYKTVFQGIFMD